MQALFRFVLAHESIGEYEANYAPVGWDDMQHTFTRDAAYHGVTVKYSLDFNFVKDAYSFIRTVYNTHGIEAEILLIIYELNPNTHKYFASYTGRINLSGYASTEIDCTVNAENTGFTQKILNLDDVSVDLTKLVSVDGLPIAPFNSELSEILLHSKATVKKYIASTDENQPDYSYFPVTDETETSGTIYIGYDTEKINEFDANTYQTGLDFSKGANSIIDFVESGVVTVDFALDFYIKCGKTHGFFTIGEIDFFIGINLAGPALNALPATPAERIWSYNRSGLNSLLEQRVQVSGTRTYNIQAGDSLYFFGYAGVFDTSYLTYPGGVKVGDFNFEWDILITGANSITVSGVTTTAPTPANGMLIHEAFTRVVQGLTGRNNGFYSELLGRIDSEPVGYVADGELSQIWLSNGSQIRGFPIADRPLYATLKEIYASLNAIKPIGLGVELLEDGTERVRLEGVDFFYKKTVGLKLGRVANLSLSVATEYFYNQVEVGYEKWGSNQDNSLDEVATKQTRTLPITQLKNKYSALSKYSASGYLIEELRRQQYVSTSDKEDSDDKTNFFVCVLRNAPGSLFSYQTERNQNLTVLNNVISPDTIYNARIWPFRNFLRHGIILRGGLRFLDAKIISFGEGNCNYLAETQFIGETNSVIENQDIAVSDLAAPLWIPEYYSFTAPLPYEQRLLLELNPYGLISFEDSLGNQKYGYIKEVKVNLNGPDADFKLLRANV